MVFEEILGYLLRYTIQMKTGRTNTIYILVAFILSLLMYSCIPTRSIIIDIPKPASKELPAEVQSITIVSQAVGKNFTNLHTDSLQKIFYRKRATLDTLIYDYQMADTTMKALGELLFESGRYDYVIPEDRFLTPPAQPGAELSWEVASALADTFQTDAVLSLDFLKTRVISDLTNETVYSWSEGGFYSTYSASIRILYEALFRVYHPAQKRILVREFIRDTLVWEDADYTIGALFERFTPVKQALTETGINIALDLAEKIAVRWRPERRRYFTFGNAAMRQADVAASGGNWEQAVKTWVSVAENARSRSLKSKAELNAALGSEILGNLDVAIEWALESYNTMYRPLTYEYLEILKRRKTEIQKE
jgi:hypothetical protein